VSDLESFEGGAKKSLMAENRGPGGWNGEESLERDSELLPKSYGVWGSAVISPCGIRGGAFGNRRGFLQFQPSGWLF